MNTNDLADLFLFYLLYYQSTKYSLFECAYKLGYRLFLCLLRNFTGRVTQKFSPSTYLQDRSCHSLDIFKMFFRSPDHGNR